MRELIKQLAYEEVQEIHTMLPVVVTAYYPDKHLVDLQIIIKKQEEYPKLTNVPCYQFNNGVIHSLSPITIGTTGVVICFEKDIEQLSRKILNQDCLSYRSFDLSDAFFMPVFNFDPKIINSANLLEIKIKETEQDVLNLNLSKEGKLDLTIKDSIDIKAGKDENEDKYKTNISASNDGKLDVDLHNSLNINVKQEDKVKASLSVNNEGKFDVNLNESLNLNVKQEDEVKASLSINNEGKLTLDLQSSIEIKVKDKLTININDAGEIEMQAENVKLTSKKTEITGDVDIDGQLSVTKGIEVDGKELKDHTHNISYQVQPTGGTTTLVAATPTGPAPVQGGVNEKTGGNN